MRIALLVVLLAASVSAHAEAAARQLLLDSAMVNAVDRKPEIARSVPEVETAYPESNMFDGQMLPAYGFYIRHADNVKFENVKITVRGTEFRKEIVTDDVSGF